MKRPKRELRQGLGRELKLVAIGIVLSVLGGAVAYLGLLVVAHKLTH
jgi:hypothetical protein